MVPFVPVLLVGKFCDMFQNLWWNEVFCLPCPKSQQVSKCIVSLKIPFKPFICAMSCSILGGRQILQLELFLYFLQCIYLLEYNSCLRSWLFYFTMSFLPLQVGLPADRQQYIHRLGRTGRKGKEGQGILLLAPWEEYFVSSIKDLPITKAHLPSVDPDTKKKVSFK